MELKKQIICSETLQLKLDGDFFLKISRSTSDNFFVLNVVNIDDYEILQEPSILEVTNKVRSDEQNQRLAKFINKIDTSNGVLGVIKTGIESLKDAVEEAHNSTAHTHAILEVFLKKDEVSSLLIKSNNIHMQLEELSLEKLEVKSANLKISIDEKNHIAKLKIKSSNMKGDLFFGEKIPMLKVSANNGKIEIVRKQEFDGLIVCDTNNVKTSGYLGKSSSHGLCTLSVNNGKIAVRSI